MYVFMYVCFHLEVVNHLNYHSSVKPFIQIAREPYVREHAVV
jgi:hypothetical protein